MDRNVRWPAVLSILSQPEPTMNHTSDLEPALARLEALRQTLNARAAGLWTCQANRVHLVAFLPAPDMPAQVVSGFSEATRNVPFERVELGCVQAAATREVVTAWAEKLPDDGGSGTWLHAFEAARSVAVPILDQAGQSRAVVAIALPETCPLSEADVTRRLRAILPA